MATKYLDYDGLQAYHNTLRVKAVDFPYETKSVIVAYEDAAGNKITPEAYEALPDTEKAKYTPVKEDKETSIKEAIKQMGADSEVEIDDKAAVTKGYLKTYDIKQGGVSIGKIDIPKDFLVKSGKVVIFTKDDATGKYYKDGVEIPSLPAGVVEMGKYIELELNVYKEDPTVEPSIFVYIYVKDLIDLYTGKEEENGISVTVSDKNVIAAEIKGKALDRKNLTDDFEADVKAIEDAIGWTKDSSTPAKDVLYAVTDRIKAEAKDGDYKEEITKYQLISDPSVEITPEAYDALPAADKALYKPVKEMTTLAEVIEELEEASGKTNGAMVFKGIVETLPTTGVTPGDTYLVGKDADGYVLKTYALDKWNNAAIDEKFLTAVLGTGYEVAADKVTVKKYIDARVFTGTTAEITAAKTAKTIDNTTVVIQVRDTETDKKTFNFITDTEIAALFAK